jgi:hypothetical protein
MDRLKRQASVVVVVRSPLFQTVGYAGCGLALKSRVRRVLRNGMQSGEEGRKRRKDVEIKVERWRR